MLPHQIVVYGNSLLLSAVAASLQTLPDWRLIPMDAQDADAAARVWQRHPDIVLTDWSVEWRAPGSPLLTLLHTCPDIPIVGLDAETNRVTILSGHQVTTDSLTDLHALIATLLQKPPA